MKLEQDINNEVNLFAPQQRKNSKSKLVLLALLSVALIALAAVNIAPMFTENNNSAIAKSEQRQEEKDALINQTMQEAQQQLGDDFYKQASGNADIPTPEATVAEQPASEPVKAEAPQKAQAAPAPATPAPAKAQVEKSKKQSEQLVTVNVTNVGRQNPFVPSVEVPSYYGLGLPKPPSATPFPEPPTKLITNESATKLMETTISGIMYDAFSPSAIIKVEGQDHLVKKGDRINGYKIVNITKDRVVVQNGTNVYRATVGEILSTEGNSVNFNTIDNLQHKFGGANAPTNTTMIHIN